MNAKITFQNYGTSILLFIEGDRADSAYGKWLSLFNWGATQTEPRWVTQNTIACWSTIAKYQKYLFDIHENRLWNNCNFSSPEMDVPSRAWQLAKQDFESTSTESYRSVNNNSEIFEFGIIAAEKPDNDFNDMVLNYAFTRN